MISTVSLQELDHIIKASHGDPHRVLGMHKIVANSIDCIAVRAFYPDAELVTVLDKHDTSIRYNMEKVHNAGFFETIIRCKDIFEYLLEIKYHDNHIFTIDDPYSFLPTITDVDRHLIGQGTHYEIFNKLGAVHRVIDGVSGFSFAVWAPNAARVSVVGSFNSWDGRRHQMRLLSNSGIWEIFIPGLQNYDIYKYEIRTISGDILLKSDPYGNFAELRPNTASFVYDINGYHWNDKKWMDDRINKNPLDGPMNIYELHMGSWDRAECGRFLSYVELSEKLIPYVKNMGYTHIELMPVMEHPFDGSWGYQVIGHYAVTSRYGSPHEFMQFVDICHQNGIGVIMDWVPAHFPKDAHGLIRFDGSALYEHQNPRQGEHPEWGTLIFNYGRPEVKNFLIGNAIFWAEKYHIDGFRVDAVASMLYLDYAKKQGEWIPNKYGGRDNTDAVEFIKHLNSIMKERYPNVLMIAEESTEWKGVSRQLNDGGLGFNLKWNMGWMNDFLKYVELDSVYRKSHHTNLTFGMMYNFTENFILVLSHDEVVHGKKSLLNKMPGDLWQKLAGLRCALGFMYGHPGKKLLFMGGEFGQFIEWDEKRPLDWFLLDFDHHKQMMLFTRDLNHLYKNDPPLWYDDFGSSGFQWLDCNDAEHSLVSFFRADDKGDFTIFVCNFTPVPWYAHKIGVPLNASYKEVLNSDDEKYGGSGLINKGIIKCENIPITGRDYSIEIVVPPLGVSVLKPVCNCQCTIGN